MIENVQRKFTKHIKGISNLSYEERLKKIKLPSLEFRQRRGDIIQVFKIAHNFYDPLSTNTIFNFSSNSRLRGHNYKIYGYWAVLVMYSLLKGVTPLPSGVGAERALYPR